MRLEGAHVSAGSVRNIWIEVDMETRYKRLPRLAENASDTGFELTEEHIRLVEKANPCFRERYVESDSRGRLLRQESFYIVRLKGLLL